MHNPYVGNTKRSVFNKILHWNDREIQCTKNLLTGFSHGQDMVHWQIYRLATTNYHNRELETGSQIRTGTTIMKTIR